MSRSCCATRSRDLRAAGRAGAHRRHRRRPRPLRARRGRRARGQARFDPAARLRASATSRQGSALIRAKRPRAHRAFESGDAFDRASLAALDAAPDDRHRVGPLRARSRTTRWCARSLAGLGRRDRAGRLPRLHRPAVASAARADRARAHEPSRRQRVGDAPAHAGGDGPARRRARASARSRQRIDEWGIFTVSLAQRA